MGSRMKGPVLKIAPDLWEKVRVLGEAAQSEAVSTKSTKDPLPFRCWIYPAKAGSRPIPLFKSLLSNICSNTCLYCACRWGRDVRRFRLTPEEMARAFWELYSRRLVKGIFLSSSIDGSASQVSEQLIATAEILRYRYGFQGYIHLKVMPGADEDLMRRAVQLADRVSVNLEASSEMRLKAICPEKDFGRILSQIMTLKEILQEGTGRARDQTTQFVVGAAGETDKEILDLVSVLYRDYGLKRCYFEAFSPVWATPLEGLRPESPLRQRRLYEASFLLRDYGFRAEELPFDRKGNLPLDFDPKMAWALRHPEFFPVELNKAEPEELLRVPGLGPRYVSKILALRVRGPLKWEDLRGLRIPLKKAAPFLTVNGRPFKRV